MPRRSNARGTEHRNKVPNRAEEQCWDGAVPEKPERTGSGREPATGGHQRRTRKSGQQPRVSEKERPARTRVKGYQRKKERVTDASGGRSERQLASKDGWSRQISG